MISKLMQFSHDPLKEDIQIFDYVWRNSGNHIVKIDLYDMAGNPGILTYTFNMGTQSPFGVIFFISIIIGVLTLTVVVIYIYIPKKFKKARFLDFIGIFAILKANRVVNSTIENNRMPIPK